MTLDNNATLRSLVYYRAWSSEIKIRFLGKCSADLSRGESNFRKSREHERTNARYRSRKSGRVSRFARNCLRLAMFKIKRTRDFHRARTLLSCLKLSHCYFYTRKMYKNAPPASVTVSQNVTGRFGRGLIFPRWNSNNAIIARAHRFPLYSRQDYITRYP